MIYENKAWGKGTVFVRWTLTAALLYGVWTETGPWTTLILFYVAASIEGMTYARFKRQQVRDLVNFADEVLEAEQRLANEKYRKGRE